MPPPRRPLGTVGRRKLEEEKPTATVLLDHCRTVVQPSHRYPLKCKDVVARHDKCRDDFDEFISSRATGTIIVGDTRVSSMDDIIENRLPYPRQTVIQPFLLHWLGGAIGVASARREPMAATEEEEYCKVKATTLFKYLTTFNAMYSRRVNVEISAEDKEAGENYCRRLIAEHQLSLEPPERTRITGDTVITLVKAAWTYPYLKLRQNLATVTYINLLAATGLRPSSISYLNEPHAFATYGDFHLYIVSTGGDMNLIYAFYTPRYYKTPNLLKSGSSPRFPLLPRRDGLVYPGLYILLSLYMDGLIEGKELLDLLDGRKADKPQTRRWRLPRAT